MTQGTTIEKKTAKEEVALASFDLPDRKGQYWKGWPHEKTDLLVAALRKLKRSERTEWENDLLYGDDIYRGKATPYVANRTRVLENEHLNHKLPKEIRKKLMQEKVCVIVNRTDRDITVDMPGGSGCTTLIMPGTGSKKGKLKDPGFKVLDAYSEAFVDRDAIKAAGLDIEDYDEKTHGARANMGVRPYVGKNPRKKPSTNDRMARASSLDGHDDPRFTAMTRADDELMRDPAVRSSLAEAVKGKD